MNRRILGVAMLCLTLLFSCKKSEVSSNKGTPPPMDKIVPWCGAFKAPDYDQRMKAAKEQQRVLSTDLDRLNPPGYILLDFNGGTITDSYWNQGQPITYAASLLTTPLRQKVIDYVIEKYSTFSVHVGTDVNAFDSTNPNRRVRCIITPTCSWSNENHCAFGGIANIGSFIMNVNVGCFAFDNGDPDIDGSNAAHEIGHTLNLYHNSLFDANCQVTTEYNPGYGNLSTGWGPIMGSCQGKALSSFSNQIDITNCANTVDEWNKINTAGIGILQLANADDAGFGDEPWSSGVPLLYSGSPSGGSILSVGDHTTFRLNNPGTNPYITVTPTITNYSPVPVQASVDIAIDLYDTNQSFIKTIENTNGPSIPRQHTYPNGRAVGYVRVRASAQNSNIPANSQRGLFTIMFEASN